MILMAVRWATPAALLALLSCTSPQSADREPSSRERNGRHEVSEPDPSPSAARVSPSPDISPTRKAPGRVTRIMLGDLFSLQQDNRALIFDVRPPFVYQLGHIPGAVNWPKASFNSQLTQNEARIATAREAKKPVVVYCVDFACPDARTVATWLAERGHSVSVLEGGWDAWKTGGLPSE